MLVLDGKIVAQKVKNRVASQVKDLVARGQKPPCLAVVLVGNDPASEVYVKNKIKSCGEVGIKSLHYTLSSQATENEVLELVSSLNQNPDVDGILVQLPLPPAISAEKVVSKISPLKDADGLSFYNLGAAFSGQSVIAPCTPAGVIEILKHYKIRIEGSHAVVIGRSQIVGRPMAALLINESATVTIAHSKTENLKHFTQSADIVVVAAGRPQFLGRDDFKKDAVIVDVGIHRLQNGLCGDVRFQELQGHVKAATPVPGGVGVMTIAMLLENTLKLKLQSQA